MTSALGLGRVKTSQQGHQSEAKTGPASGRDRGDQRPNPEDIHCSGQIVGQNRERHLGGYPWQSFGQDSLHWFELNQPARLQRSNPHRARRTFPPTMRGFLPWRLSDAGHRIRGAVPHAAGIRNPSHQRTGNSEQLVYRFLQFATHASNEYWGSG